MIKKIITLGLLLGTINTSIASIQITKDFIKFPDGSNQVKAMPNPTGEDNKVLTSNGASADWIKAAANRVGDEVQITTNGKTWTFQKDGKLIGPDGTEIGGGSGGLISPPTILETRIRTCFSAPRDGWYYIMDFEPDENEGLWISRGGRPEWDREWLVNGSVWGIQWLEKGCGSPALRITNGTGGDLTWSHASNQKDDTKIGAGGVGSGFSGITPNERRFVESSGAGGAVGGCRVEITG